MVEGTPVLTKGVVVRLDGSIKKVDVARIISNLTTRENQSLIQTSLSDESES